jgi:hypothetical protein
VGKFLSISHHCWPGDPEKDSSKIIALMMHTCNPNMKEDEAG